MREREIERKKEMREVWMDMWYVGVCQVMSDAIVLMCIERYKVYV